MTIEESSVTRAAVEVSVDRCVKDDGNNVNKTVGACVVDAVSNVNVFTGVTADVFSETSPAVGGSFDDCVVDDVSNVDV